MKKTLAILLAFLPIAMLPQSTNLPFRGPLKADWRMSQSGKNDWMPAKLPNSVHGTLIENGRIPDPFFGAREGDLEWIEKENWVFEGTFDMDEKLLEKRHVELHFKGLDTYADVFLNDSLLFSADNMFREWKTEAKKWLRPTGNRFRVEFKSAARESEFLYKKMPFELPPGPRVMTRKAQFHFGWDWGPRYVTAGIWQPIEVVAWDDFIIDDVWFKTRSIAEEKAELTCYYSYRSEIEGTQGIFLRNGTDRQRVLETRPMAIGEHQDTILINLPNPKLWWCRGMGEPFLYDWTLEIRNGTRPIDKVDRRMGVRTVELVQEPDADGSGKSFYIRLNGKPVFSKGANYIPQDIFQDRVSPQQYKKLFDDVCESNFNMLRVWGGGIYETDLFYQFADARGIMIWQDFMYACAMYPGNGRFFKTAASEAIDQMKRLRQRPSVVLFCGNNENHEAWLGWGWQAKFSPDERRAVEIDYRNLFEDLLSSYVANFTMETVDYWPSSPSWGRYNPKSKTEGDSHYWGVWHDEEPFEKYEKVVPRFMSEFGFQSFPDWKTIESFTEEKDRSLESKVMLAHQKHPRGNALIAEYMKRDYRVPKANFEHFVYVSQLLQAEGMRVGIEAHRRAKPYCMGTLYWQLNDCWPVASWSSRDYFGRWKALQYVAREAFQPVAILPKIVDEKRLDIWLSSDLPANATGGVLTIETFDFEGKSLFRSEKKDVRTSADSSLAVWSGDVSAILAGQKKENAVVEISFSLADGTKMRPRLFYFSQPKNLALPKNPRIEMTVERADDGYFLTVKSDRFAKNLLLKSKVEGHFGENFFDLLPGREVKIRFKTEKYLDDAAANFSVMSLADTF